MAPTNKRRDSRRSRRRRWLIPLSTVCILIAILHASAPAIARKAGHYLDVGKPLNKRVDFVFILGGGANDRPIIAAEIYKAGFADRILIASPEFLPDTPHEARTEADLVEGMLTWENVPLEALEQLTLPEPSTRGEILALKEYMAEHALQQGAIVTHNYHTRRVRLLVTSLMQEDMSSRLNYVSCPTDGFSPDNWWKFEAGLRTYWLEFVKYAAAICGL